jgi:hypothetical protein
MPSSRLAVLAAADSRREAMRRLFLRMFKAGQAAVPSELSANVGLAFFEMTEALDKAERVLSRDFGRILFETVTAGGDAAEDNEGNLRILAGRKVSKFDPTQSEVLNWVQKHGGQAVTDISTETRRAIRAGLEEGFRLGLSTSEIADIIQPSLGLNKKQSLAAWHRYEKLLRVMPEKRAQAAVKRYIRRQLRERALVIAKDQTLLAANEGQRLAWAQARRRGELPKSVKKRWYTARDERVCPKCGPMHGQEVDIDESFSIGNPPAHSRCRCTQELVREAAVATRKSA